MVIESLDCEFSVCTVADYSQTSTEWEYCFIGKTDGENSLVCPTCRVPDNALERNDGWRGFRIVGTLDFSLVGILARISGLLSSEGIGIFAVSTYNTDYIFVKRENLDRAMGVLSRNGYECRGV